MKTIITILFVVLSTITFAQTSSRFYTETPTKFDTTYVEVIEDSLDFELYLSMISENIFTNKEIYSIVLRYFTKFYKVELNDDFELKGDSEFFNKIFLEDPDNSAPYGLLKMYLTYKTDETLDEIDFSIESNIKKSVRDEFINNYMNNFKGETVETFITDYFDTHFLETHRIIDECSIKVKRIKMVVK